MSLADIISANPILSTTECLCRLCTELDIIQRSVDPAYHGPVHLRENIIRACRGHPALANGLTNPPMDASGLVNNLYTSIVNYEAVHKPTSTQQTYIQSDVEDDSELFFTDRQYRKNMSGFRPCPCLYGKSNNISYTTPYRRRKKCFVCGKEGCWSTSHTQQERDFSKKRFGDQYPEYTSRQGFDRRFQQYIIHCERDEHDTDEITQFFEELSVDTTLQNLVPEDISS